MILDNSNFPKLISSSQWRESETTVSNKLSYALKNIYRPDFLFKVGPKKAKFEVHKCIIMASCEQFATKLTEEWDELGFDVKRGMKFLTLPEDSPKAFKQILQFWYEDTLPDDITTAQTIDIINFAINNKVSHLLKACFLIVQRQMHSDYDACIEILNRTYVFKNGQGVEIYDYVFQRILTNFDQLAETNKLLNVDLAPLEDLVEVYSKNWKNSEANKNNMCTNFLERQRRIDKKNERARSQLAKSCNCVACISLNKLANEPLNVT